MKSYSEINNPELVAIEANTVKRISMIANTNYNLLNECRLYLNDKGKAVKEVHSIIENACEFATTIEDVKKEIQRMSNEEVKDEAIKRRLNTFITTYLDGMH